MKVVLDCYALALDIIADIFQKEGATRVNQRHTTWEKNEIAGWRVSHLQLFWAAAERQTPTDWRFFSVIQLLYSFQESHSACQT